MFLFSSIVKGVCSCCKDAPLSHSTNIIRFSYSKDKFHNTNARIAQRSSESVTININSVSAFTYYLTILLLYQLIRRPFTPVFLSQHLYHPASCTSIEDLGISTGFEHSAGPSLPFVAEPKKGREWKFVFANVRVPLCLFVLRSFENLD